MKTYQKVLSLLFVVMTILLGIKFYKDQKSIQDTNKILALRESKSLVNFIESSNSIYQKIFDTFGLDNQELSLFLHPVVVISQISKKYMKDEDVDGIIKTVSDNPVNNKNMANNKELKAIQYLKENKDKKFYFKLEKSGEYFFAKPIYLNESCLNCHRSKKERPKYMNNISGGLGYGLGDMKGIIALYGDNNKTIESLYKEHYYNMFFYITFSLSLFFLIYIYFTSINKKDEKYKIELEEEVLKQTRELQEKNAEILRHLNFDSLTNLPNRNMMIRDLKTNNKNTLVLINMDDFKQINDFFGSNIGDEVLESFAQFMDIFAKQNEYRTYKLHADEYALIGKKDNMNIVIEEISSFIESIRQFVVMTDDANNLEITATAGISFENTQMLSCADMALKKAKAEKTPFLIYNESMAIKEQYKKNIECAKKLKKALKDEKIIPYFQPLKEVASEKIVKYEALARMIDENENIITPNVFLEVSKTSKLYNGITQIIYEKAFERFKDEKSIGVSVNISIIDIQNKETRDFIFSKIKDFSEPSRITFELLESEGIENYDDAYEFLDTVKTFGCKVAIDDFGSGYSNFLHILKLNVDILKIDASLIKRVDVDENAKITVSAIVSFANALGIETCAEFVHSHEVYEVLKRMGLTYVQGYHIGKPLPDLVE